MTRIIFLTLGPNTQENFSSVLDYYGSADVHFSHFWGDEKQLFHIAPFRSTIYVLKSFVCLEVSSLVSKWNKGKNLIFIGSTF